MLGNCHNKMGSYGGAAVLIFIAIAYALLDPSQRLHETWNNGCIEYLLILGRNNLPNDAYRTNQ